MKETPTPGPALGRARRWEREVGWVFSSKTILLWDPRDVFFLFARRECADNFLSEFCRWRSCHTCEVDSVQCSGIAWCSALGSAPIYFVLFFCSFLLLGRAPRASRPTGRSCSCVLRPPRSSDKILSSWKPRSQESVVSSLKRKKTSTTAS